MQKGVLIAKLATLAAALLLYSPSALAWGGLGHEVICELAFLELDDTIRQRVIALIEQDQEFTTFRASCKWADKPRQRASEHFVNLPRDATGLDDNKCPMADECVVSAIERDFEVLASPHATDGEKLVALKFLGHWVGDIHQPLHAASQDDRGGNYIRTQGSSCESLGGADRHAQDLSAAIGVHRDGHGHGDRDNPAGLAHLHVSGVDPQIGPVTLERALEKGSHPLVDLGAEAAHLALADAGHAQRLDQLVD
jgi:hypothetical protein